MFFSGYLNFFWEIRELNGPVNGIKSFLLYYSCWPIDSNEISYELLEVLYKGKYLLAKALTWFKLNAILNIKCQDQRKYPWEGNKWLMDQIDDIACSSILHCSFKNRVQTRRRLMSDWLVHLFNGWSTGKNIN